MFWMISCVMNAMGCSVVANMHPSFVEMLTAFSIIVNTVGRLSILCRASTATDRWLRRDSSGHER